MAGQDYFDIRGINTYTNPVQQDGVLIHCVNMVSTPLGAKTKRTGYSAYLGTPDSSTVQNLFVYNKSDGTSLVTYRKSGSIVYYSLQGTGAWTILTLGTVDATAYVGHVVTEQGMLVGDGVNATRWSISGTALGTAGGIALAPISNSFESYQGRIYAAGTASTLVYAVTNDITNWNTTGTSDSSSFTIPGAGKLLKVFKTGDRLIATKTSGIMFKWDGYNLVDMTTSYGPSSAQAVGAAEDYRFFVNEFGVYGFGGGKPQLLSNAIQRQFYNSSSTGIAGTTFTTIPATCHIYDYLVSVGSFSDDFTGRTLTNGIVKYDYQKNEFLNWDLATRPTSWLSYKDPNRVQTLLFGDNAGQVYKFDNTTSDNGTAIVAEMIFVFNYGAPAYEKKWNAWTGIFNPGCEAKVQIACANGYGFASLRWVDVANDSSGVMRHKLPADSQSELLFIRISESSKNSRFTFYGQTIEATVDYKY